LKFLDHTLKRILRNTGYLFSSTGISMVLSVVQSIFAARLLGVNDLGILATITVFASTITKLFSFRMSELVIKYLGEYLPHPVPSGEEGGGSSRISDLPRAAALVKLTALTETATSILAFFVLLITAPFAARYFAKSDAYTPLFIFYGISVLSNFVAETSTGVLQALDRFRPQALVNIGQSVLTAALIVYAYLTHAGLVFVLGTYLIGKLILDIGPSVFAWFALNERLGKGWWRAPLSGLPPLRELARFAISTNLSATINLLVRDSELLWVAFFMTPTAVGYYKIALAIISLVGMPITPLINATFPEISRFSASGERAKLRSLLKRVTLLSAAVTAGSALFLILFGKWAIWLYGAEYLPAYPALIVLLLGFGVANILFWNRPLLLSYNQPVYPLKVNLICGIFKILASFVVIPAFGFVGAAWLLSGYLLVSVDIIVVRGLKELSENGRILAKI
jgi:O-antigen/teichoic acid export membrane protein